MLQPERYQSPEVESLIDFQRIEREFAVNSGFDLQKEGLLAAFQEELFELRTEIEMEKINSLALASEIADNLIYILSLASYSEIDIENTLIEEEGLNKDEFSFSDYAKNTTESDRSCLTSGEEVLSCMSNKVVNKILLKKKLVQYLHDLTVLANENNLSVTKIMARKMNRNFYKYASLRGKMENGLDVKEARVEVKKEWAKEAEDEKFLRDFFLDYARAEDYEEIAQMVHKNFDEAKNYQDLSPEQKALYKKANGYEGVKSTCENASNFAALVMRSNDAEKKVIGYVVLRPKEEEKEPTVQIRRFHVHLDQAQKGVGSALLREVEELAKEGKFSFLAVNASGDSFSWFKKHGFILIETKLTSEGVFQGNNGGSHQATHYKMMKGL